jgi:hypothetical protein
MSVDNASRIVNDTSRVVGERCHNLEHHLLITILEASFGKCKMFIEQATGLSTVKLFTSVI